MWQLASRWQRPCPLLAAPWREWQAAGGRQPAARAAKAAAAATKAAAAAKSAAAQPATPRSICCLCVCRQLLPFCKELLRYAVHRIAAHHQQPIELRGGGAGG